MNVRSSSGVDVFQRFLLWAHIPPSPILDFVMFSKPEWIHHLHSFCCLCTIILRFTQVRQGTAKTGNLVLTFYRQGDPRNFALTRKNLETRGKYFNYDYLSMFLFWISIFLDFLCLAQFFNSKHYLTLFPLLPYLPYSPVCLLLVCLCIMFIGDIKQNYILLCRMV